MRQPAIRLSQVTAGHTNRRTDMAPHKAFFTTSQTTPKLGAHSETDAGIKLISYDDHMICGKEEDDSVLRDTCD